LCRGLRAPSACRRGSAARRGSGPSS
jgi:hypothetical protein